MGLGGDPADLRADAVRVRAWAADLDAHALQIYRSTQVEWKSVAADAYRDKITERRRDADAVAVAVRDVADTLDRLADTLEDRQHTLSDLLEKAGKTLEDVKDALAHGAEDALGAAQGVADDALEAGKDLVEGGKDLIGKIL